MKKALVLALAFVLAMGVMAVSGPYLGFEQSLLPTGAFMPSCETTLGFDYTLGNFARSAGEFAQTGSQVSIEGDLYVTTPNMWAMAAVTVGHELNLGWSHIEIDLVTEVDLGLAALSADRKSVV